MAYQDQYFSFYKVKKTGKVSQGTTLISLTPPAIPEVTSIHEGSPCNRLTNRSSEKDPFFHPIPDIFEFDSAIKNK
jgi:hypothetical protein